MAGRLNRKLSSSKYYVKDVDCFSDAGIYKGEGGAIFSQDSGKFSNFILKTKTDRNKFYLIYKISNIL